jgi:hypothetical protein
MQTIVDQTNLYAQQQITAELPQPSMKHRHSEQWQPVTITGMKKFVGLIILIGII